jgi:hypothetical protein
MDFYLVQEIKPSSYGKSPQDTVNGHTQAIKTGLEGLYFHKMGKL